MEEVNPLCAKSHTRCAELGPADLMAAWFGSIGIVMLYFLAVAFWHHFREMKGSELK